MQTATASIYWVIVALWLAVLVTVATAYARNPRIFGVTRLLLIVVGVDTTRNIIENLYFGLYFGSQYGLFEPSIANTLGSPYLLIVPKIVNVLAACVVLGLLLFRWLPLALTERLQAERVVEAKTRQLSQEVEERRQIIETALDAFMQIDARGKVLQWSSQAEKTFGVSPNEAIGSLLEGVIGLDAAYKTQLENIGRGQGDGGGLRIQAKAKGRKAEELQIELSVTSSERQDDRVFNIFARDITEKMAAENQLRQSQKMEAVGQLTGGVAHDFNNILTVITGTIGILQDAVSNRPELVSITRMIDEAADRGANLTRHLLAFARKQPLQPVEVDVNSLILEAAKLLRPTLGEQIEISPNLADDAWSAMVDPSQLSTAILNLSLNARDAMPQGGKLTLETRNVFLDEGYVSMNSEVAVGNYVVIAVSDTGSGIPAPLIEKVFDPFFTTKEVGRGTGLGLSMVFGFVRQSGGHVKIYSEVGHGTTIRLYLPRSTVSSQSTGEVTLAAPFVGGDETVLVVEDDTLVRKYVMTQLQGLGYATLEAANGTEALDIIEIGGKIDLLFTDVIMPGSMNGPDLVQRAQLRRPDIKILYTSGYSENAIVHNGRLDAGVLLLSKPYRRIELARMLRTALDGVTAPHV
jgi:PAS domain S-box-containing protein